MRSASKIEQENTMNLTSNGSRTLFRVRNLMAVAVACAAWLDTGSARGQTIGINVRLNQPASETILDDLGTHGQVLEVMQEINAVTLRAHAAELSAIQSLSYVAGANPDAPRFLTRWDVPVPDFTDGANVWNLDAIDVTDFGGGRVVDYDGEGVYVAVIDSGLVNNWREYFPEERIATQHARAFGGGGGDHGTVSEQPEHWEHDTVGHGTAITSVILGFNYSGPEPLPTIFNGVAPKATVIPLKIQSNNSALRSQSSVVTRGLLYVVDLKVSGALGSAPVVVNFSLGGPDPDSVERAAIDYAIANGVVVVAGAGNRGESGMEYPAAYAPVISVAASAWVRQFPTDDPSLLQWIERDVPENDALQHNITPFSGRELPGQDLDVAAPGFPVPIAFTQNGKVDYTYFSGTSAACPHVVGVAALLLQKNPQLMQTDIEAIIEQTALPLPAGCVDVRVGFFGNGGANTWSNLDTMFVFDFTACWNANATGAGVLQADAALAATPLP